MAGYIITDATLRAIASTLDDLFAPNSIITESIKGDICQLIVDLDKFGPHAGPQVPSNPPVCIELPSTFIDRYSGLHTRVQDDAKRRIKSIVSDSLEDYRTNRQQHSGTHFIVSISEITLAVFV